jgi:hypothetical protein
MEPRLKKWVSKRLTDRTTFDDRRKAARPIKKRGHHGFQSVKSYRCMATDLTKMKEVFDIVDEI